MNRLAWVLIAAVLCACATETPIENPPPTTEPTAPGPVAPGPRGIPVGQLVERLGMQRDPQDLGYNQKPFNGCKLGMVSPYEACGMRFLTVINFRLLCREGNDTTENVPIDLTPLATDRMEWRLAGSRGMTRTDARGFGQVAAVTRGPTKSQRFILILGRHSLGVEAGEVSQLILPNEWCEVAASSRSSHRLNSLQYRLGDPRIAGQ